MKYTFKEIKQLAESIAKQAVTENKLVTYCEYEQLKSMMHDSGIYGKEKEIADILHI